MRFWKLFLGAGLLWALPTAEAREGDNDATLAARARAVLRQIVTTDQTWVRVHAAEALIAAGEGEAMHALFLRERPGNEATAYRIGVWRVLANTAPNAEDRAIWIAKVEQVFSTPPRPTARKPSRRWGNCATG